MPSASESLRALDEVIRNGVPDESEPALWSLKPALPLIADVVEAAEGANNIMHARAELPHKRPERPDEATYWTSTIAASVTAQGNLDAALTALRDALQEGQDGSPPPPEGATAP